MNGKQLGLGALALVIFALVGWRLFGGKGDSIMPRTFEGHGVCLACKTETTIQYEAKTLPPYKCPSCDQDAFYTWWYCSECQHRFIPELTNESPRRPVRFPACTHCNCKGVSGWMDAQLMPTRGDAKLPKWP